MSLFDFCIENEVSITTKRRVEINAVELRVKLINLDVTFVYKITIDDFENAPKGFLEERYLESIKNEIKNYHEKED
jgi:Zn-finger domain-containing protein